MFLGAALGFSYRDHESGGGGGGVSVECGMGWGERFDIEEKGQSKGAMKSGPSHQDSEVLRQ